MTSPTGSVTAPAPSPPPPPPSSVSLNPNAEVFEGPGEAQTDAVLPPVEEETPPNVLGSTVDTPCSEITDPPWGTNAEFVSTESKC